MSGLIIVFGALIVIVLFVIALASSNEDTVSKREYGVKSVTLNGEKVKSIAERRIADYFLKNNISMYMNKKQGAKVYFLITRLVLLISIYQIMMFTLNIGD